MAHATTFKYAPSLVTPPGLAVPLPEAKAHLRVTVTEDDALITTYINAAASHLEKATGIVIATQTWRQDFDEFRRDMYLPLRPVQSIAEIEWRSADDVTAEIDAEDYTLLTDPVGRSYVRFEDGFEFPGPLWPNAAVQIQFVSGYETLPEGLRAAILLMVGHLYANREAVTDTGVHEVPLGVEALASLYRRAVA